MFAFLESVRLQAENQPLIQMSLIFLHIAAGFAALIFAPIAMAVQKGGKAHRLWGKVYFWAMFAIFVTALALLVFRPNIFLFIISIFSFYSAFSGYRGLFRKRGGASWLDWFGGMTALLAGLAFFVWGSLPLLNLMDAQAPIAFHVMGIAFGVVIVMDARSDIRSFIRLPTDKNWWWYYHMSRMIGSYIAAVTAFLVQNVGSRMPADLSWIVWVAPGLIGGTLIGRWVRHYRTKFAARSEARV